MRFTVATIIASLSVGTSVFATPIISSPLVVRNDPASCVTTITGAVATLNVDVNVDLNTTVSAVATLPEFAVVPFVEFNVAKIIASFNAALAVIIPVTFAAPIVLAEAQVELLLESVKIFDALILNLKAQFDYILVTVHEDTIALIKVQLEAALNIASILGKAYVNSVSDIIDAVIDVETTILGEVKATVLDIQHVIDNVLCVL